MDLLTYLKAQPDGTATATCPALAALAEKAGMAKGTLYQIVLGHKRPSGPLAARIAAATGGAVSRASLRPDIFGDAPDQAEAA